MFQVRCAGCGAGLPNFVAGSIDETLSFSITAYRPTGIGTATLGTPYEDEREVPNTAGCATAERIWYCESCWRAKDIDTLLRSIRQGNLLDYAKLHG